MTELNQAVLCDDMPALAAVQLGPTGKAVSRSYAATLSKFTPKGRYSYLACNVFFSLMLCRHNRRCRGC